MRWIFGDLHCYSEPSHMEVAKAIVNCDLHDRTLPPPKMVYHGDVGSEFEVDDFSIIGRIDVPVTTTRPRLL